MHVPEEVSHRTHKTIIYEPANKIIHYQHRKYPQKSVGYQLRHNQHNYVLEDNLLADFKNPTVDSNVAYVNPDEYGKEHLTQQTEIYKYEYDNAAYKRPVKYINTYKVIKCQEPIKSKTLYPPHPHKHQHKSKTYNELYKFIKSKYLPTTGDGHELHKSADSRDHYHYPVRTHTNSIKPHTHTKVVTYQGTANNYHSYKHTHYIEPPYYDADPSPLVDFKLNTSVYLSPYDIPALSAAYDFLTPKETLTIPTSEAADFHGQFPYHAFNDGTFKPFIGDMYLPVGEERPIRKEAAETYMGIDSYSASHVQGLDYLSYSPYRRWSTFI